MMALWMVYALIISTLLFLLGVVGERLAELFRAPRRWIWVSVAIAAMAGIAMVPLRPRAVTRSTPAVASPAASVANIATSVKATFVADAKTGVETSSPLQPLRTATQDLKTQLRRSALPLGQLWAIVSGAIAITMLIGALLLARRRRAWPWGRFGDAAVLVSPNDGPAIVGVFEPQIVVPTWALELEPPAQRLIVAHELEHIRAGDPLLNRCATAMLILMPWNLPFLAMGRRLKVAIELDCDQRLLESQSIASPHSFDISTYAELLFSVAQRRSLSTSRVAPAFFQPYSSFKRRIKAMSPQRVPFRRLQSVVALGAVAAILWLTIATPAPRLEAQQAAGGVARTTQKQSNANVIRVLGSDSVSLPLATAAAIRPALSRFYPRLLKQWTDKVPVNQQDNPGLWALAFIRNADGTITDTISLHSAAEIGLLARTLRPEGMTAAAAAARLESERALAKFMITDRHTLATSERQRAADVRQVEQLTELGARIRARVLEMDSQIVALRERIDTVRLAVRNGRYVEEKRTDSGMVVLQRGLVDSTRAVGAQVDSQRVLMAELIRRASQRSRLDDSLQRLLRRRADSLRGTVNHRTRADSAEYLADKKLAALTSGTASSTLAERQSAQRELRAAQARALELRLQADRSSYRSNVQDFEELFRRTTITEPKASTPGAKRRADLESAKARELASQVSAFDIVTYNAGELWTRPLTVYYITRKP